MIDRQQHTGAQIQGFLSGGEEPAVVQREQGVHEKGGIEAMLTEIFVPGAEHQTPAADQFHPGEHGKKAVLHEVFLRR